MEADASAIISLTGSRRNIEHLARVGHMSTLFPPVPQSPETASAASRHSSPLLRTPSTAEALSLDTASTHHSRESARLPPSGRTDGSPRGKAAAGDEAGRNRTMVAAKRDVARGRMGVAPPKKAFEGKGGGYAAAKV